VIFERSGRPEIAATVYGASTRAAIIHTIVDLPETLNRLRAALGNTAFDGFVATGASMELADAVGFARRHVRFPLATGRKEAGIPDATFHDLRRINATQLMAAAIEVNTVQTRLGHADPRLTPAIYAQAVHRFDRSAARLDERFFGAGRTAREADHKIPRSHKGGLKGVTATAPTSRRATVAGRLDPDVIAAALQEMVEGVSLSVLVAQYGISNGALRQHFANAALTRHRDAPRDRPTLPESAIAPAWEAMAAGASQRQAAGGGWHRGIHRS
jgi:Phage integrase family